VPTLWAASFRHLLRHPAQLALALIGLSLGVATIIAVDIATASSRLGVSSCPCRRSTALPPIRSLEGPQGIDERLYVDLRTRDLQPGQLQPAFAPIVAGYVTVGDRTMQLVGIDPLASPELGAGSGRQPELPVGETQETRVEALRKWFTERGAVVMAARTAQATRDRARPQIRRGRRRGVLHPAVLINQIRNEGAAYDALVLTDIAQAQEWLGSVGRLSRIDVRGARWKGGGSSPCCAAREAAAGRAASRGARPHSRESRP